MQINADHGPTGLLDSFSFDLIFLSALRPGPWPAAAGFEKTLLAARRLRIKFHLGVGPQPPREMGGFEGILDGGFNMFQ